MIKKLFKGLGVLLVLVLLLAGAFVFHTWNFKPLDINLFFARLALQTALENPEMLSSIRVLEPMGLEFHNDDLNDASMAAGDRLLARLKSEREVLKSYDDEDLDPADRHSKEIALYLLDFLDAGERFRFHNYPVNQMMGIHSSFPTFMQDSHQVHDVGDAEDYVTRLSKAGVKFDQVIEGLRHRAELGIQPPQFVVDKALATMVAFSGVPVEESVLYTAFTTKLDEASIEGEDRRRLGAEASREIETTVYPAYARLIEYFRALDAEVEGNRGVWALPEGNELYRLALQVFTTTDIPPEEIHRIGLAEVDRIQAEMLAILEGEGRDTSAGFTATMAALAEDSAFYYPDTDDGRAAILADYQTIIDEISAGLGEAFDVRPRAAVEVRREAEFKEATAPGAHYQAPAMDGSRPGVFVANLGDIKATPKYGMRTLAYHEAVPGHHFQIAIQMELEDLPFFRRLLPLPAFSEGWGLYAERLAWELGFVDDPYDNIGRLQAELFRAVRLVVDTGIHHQRWNREEAVEYMLSNTGMAESDVVAEIERYFVMPGQACAYKIGMMKILELRRRAQDELGEDFDLRDFHRVVLTGGSLPLMLLEEKIDEYIAAERG